tara:strand:- start:77 stop:409 length:333 start_codon:yes stop_codon:yes gene_type:complete
LPGVVDVGVGGAVVVDDVAAAVVHDEVVVAAAVVDDDVVGVAAAVVDDDDVGVAAATSNESLLHFLSGIFPESLHRYRFSSRAHSPPKRLVSWCILNIKAILDVAVSLKT